MEKPRTTRYTESAEAWEAYVKGRYFWNKRTEEGSRRAIEHFNVALTRDPTFTLAMSGLADSYALLGSMPNDLIQRHEAMSRARSFAERALEIDDGIAEAHTSLGFVKMHYDWDWKGAEAEFRRALALNPGYPTAHHWYAYLLLSQGRIDKAVAAIRKAEKFDPLSSIISTDVAEVLFYAGRYDESCSQIERTLRMDPHFPLAHQVAASCHGALRDFEKALEHLDRSEDLGRNDGSWYHVPIYAAAGKTSEATRLYQELKASHLDQPDSAVIIAQSAFALGLDDEGFAFMEKAYAERSGSLILLKVAFPGLRSDPRYHDLLRRMGLPAEPRSRTAGDTSETLAPLRR